LTNAKEFSSEAEYRNPSLSFILPDIICTHCSDVRNIDLLRDPYIMNGVWECSHCHNEYNKYTFEKLLVDFIQRKVVSFQTQDLICSRCNNVKENNTTNHCSNCSSPFKLSVPALDVISAYEFIFFVN
jgi:DNA polymerase epsilon subunit 1